MSDSQQPNLYIDSFTVHPEPSFFTYQFSSEVLNAIINALLVTLILVNAGSIASKLMHRTEKNHFRYEHWVRAFIYVSSDDPVRLINWIRGRYEYRRPDWNRNNCVAYRRRLTVPLCTRALLLLLAAVSIVISAPGERTLPTCTRGDHRLVLDEKRAQITAESGTGLKMPSLCVPVQVKSRLGTLRSQTTYCAEFGRFDNKIIPDYLPSIQERYIEGGEIVSSGNKSTSMRSRQLSTSVSTADIIVVVERSTIGVVATYIQDSTGAQFCLGFKSSVGWNLGERPFFELLSFLPGIWGSEVHSKVIVNAISYVFKRNCFLERDVIDSPEMLFVGKTPAASYYLVKCDSGIEASDLSGNDGALSNVQQVEKYFRGSLRWEETPEIQGRLLVSQNGDTVKMEFRCPTSVSVQSPWVNIMPLITILAVTIIVNIAATIYLSRIHGDIFDASFHLINEVLQRDTTCNPLEKSRNEYEVEYLTLKLFRCADGAAHVGFLRRKGDEEVADMRAADIEDCVVSNCATEGEYIFDERCFSRNDHV